MEIEVATKALSVGEMIGVEKDGKAILIANVNGIYYAIGDICPHKGCKISEGTLNGEKVQCPCHGSTFDVRTGAVIKGPAKDPKPTFKLNITHDQVLVDV